jgi:uncharacterized protein
MTRITARGVLRARVTAPALLLAWTVAAAEVPVPPLAARVTDLTSTLTADQRGALEQKLAALESRKGSQVAVLLVPTVQPETVEQYAVRVFEQWKLGRKGVDDGVLLVVAKNDRKLRIEVGYGLEGAIPDAVAKRIIEEEIVPRFKQGDFHGGIAAGTDRIVRLAEGEAMPPPAPRRPAPSPYRAAEENAGLPIAFFGLIAFAFVMQWVLRGLLGMGIAVLGSGVAVYFLSGPVLAVVAVILVLLASAVFMSILTPRARWSPESGWSSVSGWPSGGSWSSGSSSWSSSSSSGSFSDSGGFSGGGGSSGGGGASGSW